MNKLPSNFCPAPWVARIIHVNGDISPCCFSKLKNEQEIADLKKSFINNEKDSRCDFCWKNEEQGLHSPRFDFIKSAGSKLEFNKDINSIDDIDQIQLVLGNYCNAECIICDGASSSRRNTWTKQHNKIKWMQNAIQIANDNVDFSKYPNINTLSLIGGEPAIHPTTHTILDKFISNDTAKNISIRLNTNASRLDQKLLDKLKEFKNISVTLSIDSSGVYFEYQRRPLEWETVKQVSNTWMEISENITINYVVSAISIWGFNGFVEWYENLPIHFKEKRPSIIITHINNLANNNDHLSLGILNDKQRANWIDTAVDHPLKVEIENIIQGTEYAPRLLPLFKQTIKLEDQTSKIKFAEIFPDWDLNGKA